MRKPKWGIYENTFIAWMLLTIALIIAVFWQHGTIADVREQRDKAQLKHDAVKEACMSKVSGQEMEIMEFNIRLSPKVVEE
jgi:hypothetical protein